jgi:hypothetical protein
MHRIELGTDYRVTAQYEISADPMPQSITYYSGPGADSRALNAACSAEAPRILADLIDVLTDRVGDQ